jgi:hypothetical protein
MIKTFVATGFSCLALGSITGYLIADMTRQPSVQASTMIAPSPIASPKPMPLPNRNDLELRYQIAVGYKVTKSDLSRFTDLELNNLVAELEARKRLQS